MSTQSFSVGEAIRFGWERFKENSGFLILLTLLTGLVSSILSSAQTSAARGGAGASAGLIGLLGAVINALILMGVINISIKIIDGKKAEFGYLFSPYRLFFQYVVASLLYGLMVSVGLILFIIPGIYLAIRFQLFAYFIIDRNAGIIDSLRMSWDATRRFTGTLFLLDLAAFGIIILGAIALGVGLLVAVPVVELALAYAYRKLQSRLEPAAQVNPAA